ncbi:MAG: rhodanese-like domain-containing protein [Cyanobacteria bacterium P01_H01_bin.15]
MLTGKAFVIAAGFLLGGSIFALSLNWRGVSWFFLKRKIRLAFPTVETIGVTELAEWLAEPARPQPLILDTRTLQEYQISHLPQAQWLDPDKSTVSGENYAAIVVYCSVGYRSAQVAQTLQGQGVTLPVYNLEGSIFAWVATEHPVFQGEQVVQAVHPFNETWGRFLPVRWHPTHWEPIR